MAKLNRRKFSDCVVNYKRDCLSSFWRRPQQHKFYFANYLNSRVNLQLQLDSAVYEICKGVESKNFYFSDGATRIKGLQFLEATGNSVYSEPLCFNDVQIFKRIAGDNTYCKEDFAGTGLSFDALSGWLGTLIPDRFAVVTSNHLQHVISYLFDEQIPIYDRDPYDFFVYSQERFQATKEHLKDFEFRSLYLADINDYIGMTFPKCVGKRMYDEADWNWITQDFYLYVYREMMHMDSIRMFAAEVNPEAAGLGYNLHEGMYVHAG